MRVLIILIVFQVNSIIGEREIKSIASMIIYDTFRHFSRIPVHAINLARPETNGVSSADKKSRLARIGL